MDSEGRALELAIELTLRTVSQLPVTLLLRGATMDSEGRVLLVELAIELTPRTVSQLPVTLILTGATMDSEGRGLELGAIELGAVSWMLGPGVVGWVELAGTVYLSCHVRDSTQ
jgi:hypothetical protein